MERILVGVDGSAPSLKAVDFAADLAGKYNAELILLKVVEDRPPELEAAVKATCGEEVRVHGAGRTDAGVHALGQVAHCDIAKPFTASRLRDALNAGR